jgi:hypothetical protein
MRTSNHGPEGVWAGLGATCRSFRNLSTRTQVSSKADPAMISNIFLEFTAG